MQINATPRIATIPDLGDVELLAQMGNPVPSPFISVTTNFLDILKRAVLRIADGH